MRDNAHAPSARRGKRHSPFSATNQPAGRGRKPKDLPEPTGQWNGRQVLRLAEQGVESSDIAKVLGLTGRLQGDSEVRSKFEELVDLGHAQHRAQVARRVRKEADRGKSNALKELAHAWLPRYAEESLTDTDEQGIIERGLELIRQIKKRRVENASASPAVV